jgi:glycosyltransferase involved in cell wall biosynthesis
VRFHRSDLFFERWDKLENPHVEQAFSEWLGAFKPDIVHVHHWARLTTTLVRTAASCGIPVVVSLHDLFASCPRYHRVREDGVFCEVGPSVEACLNCAPRWQFQKDVEIGASLEMFVADLRQEVAAAAALVAPTEGHGQRVMKWLGLDVPIRAIPPAGSSLGQPATLPLADRVASATEPMRVGVFGHLHPLKGVEVLLDAQAALPEPDRLEVHVWGEAPDEKMAAEVRSHAGGRRVVWHGAYHPEDLAGAPIDVAVLPTLCAESYSFTLDEAAGLGVPIVATDLGALADRATGRTTLFPRGDVQALAKTLLRLAQEPGVRAAMRAAPGPSTQDDNAHLDSLRSLYEQVLSAPQPPVSSLDSSALARRAHAFDLREAGLQELLRGEGWESVVEGLQGEVSELRGRLED